MFEFFHRAALARRKVELAVMKPYSPPVEPDASGGAGSKRKRASKSVKPKST
jgi:hypothetical protein